MVAIAALLLILFLFRPGVGKLRSRIAGSIGNALGRRVELDNVRLRVLPRPGFDLEGLVIYDDPAFSAEPMIRAQEVSAAIRFRSLLRGRIEIATLSATEPSINLVRNNAGRWNLTGLLERNAQIPAAPTAKPAYERRPAFPYLEATGARINFKIGQTKKSYALMDADVALWQDSENSWGARLKAAPVRTDFNLTDTGRLQINATWQRASSARSTPLQIAVEWQKGQLGQLTQLLSGKDRGWRGGVNFDANLSGTPEALRIESNATIDDFHRYDIVGNESVRLTARCSGQYDWVTSSLADLKCESPVETGTLRLRGAFVGAAQFPTYDLTLDAEKVPLASVVRLLRQAKKQIPGDLTASGLLNAEFHATRRADEAPVRASRGSDESLPRLQWTGDGLASDVRLSSNAGKDDFAIGTIPLTLVAVSSDGSRLGRSKSFSKSLGARTSAKEIDEEPCEAFLRIGTAALATNDAAPVSVGGWISASGYRFFLRGDAELKDLFRLENALGLRLGRASAEGSAKLDVSVSGRWRGFATATALGSAQLRNVHAEMRGLNTPVEISSATMTLTPDAVLLQKISARTGSTHWTGGVTAPRNCGSQGVPGCIFQFDLAADELSTGDLAEWFALHSAKRPWYRILNSAPPSESPLLALQGHGKLHIGRFGIRKLIATQLATQVDVDRGKITLTGLRAQLLQGTHQGNWTIAVQGRNVPRADLPNATVPVRESPNRAASDQALLCHGAGTLQNISLTQLGRLMNDSWITGMADGIFSLDGSGQDLRDFLAHSDGTLQFAMRDGSYPHIQIPGATGSLPVHRFTGDLALKNGVWELSAGTLESRDGIYQLKGTASASSGFDFVLTRGDEQSWNVNGTLAKPHVTPVDRNEGKRAKSAAVKSTKP